MQLFFSAVGSVAVAALLLGARVVHAGTDWPYWVGPQGTGASNEVPLPDRWNPAGGEESHLIWSVKIGSRSTPTSMNGRLYLLTESPGEDTQNTQEKLVCLDAGTGESLWEYAMSASSSANSPKPFRRSSAVCDPQSGNVFVQDAGGFLWCVNGETGKPAWQHSLCEEFGFVLSNGDGSSGPIVFENNVMINAVMAGWGEQATLNHRFLAMDKKNGMPAWIEGTDLLLSGVAGSAPVIGVVDGERQMACATRDGDIHGFHPRTGKLLWSCSLSRQGTTATPLIFDHRVYCGYADGMPDSVEKGAVLCLNPTLRGDLSSTGVIWKKTGYALGRSSPQMIDGRLYFVTDDATLYCLNPEDGEQIGEPVGLGTSLWGNLLSADGKIYVIDANGHGTILKPVPHGAEIIFQFDLPSGEECYGSPIAMNGRIYLPTSSTLYCIGNADSDAASPVREWAGAPREQHVALDEIPASLQVVPVESLLSPGTRQVFHARIYNSRGQYLRNARPDELIYQLTGPGEINSTTGAYTIPSSHTQHDTARLAIRFDDMEGNARLRIIPDLDWSFDFNDGQIPAIWVGCAARYAPLDWDLFQKLRQKDPVTGRFYLYLMNRFANSDEPLVLDDSTPQQHWKALLEFMGMETGPKSPGTIEEGKARFEASLQTLVEERVLAGFQWSSWQTESVQGSAPAAGLRLSIVRGDRQIDKNGVLCNLFETPQNTFGPVWMGPSSLHDYTIQVDVLCLPRQNQLPETGVIAQRNVFNFLGTLQQQQLGAWMPSSSRPFREAPREWKPDVWDTMKLRAETRQNQIILSGKIWTQGETEPAEWSLTAEVTGPDQVGSPGLWGESRHGELFFDNLTVTRNISETP